MGPLSSAAARMFSTSVQRGLERAFGSSIEKTAMGEASSAIAKEVNASAQKVFQSAPKSLSNTYQNLERMGNKMGFGDPIEEAGQTIMDITFKPDFESSVVGKISKIPNNPFGTNNGANFDFTSLSPDRFSVFSPE